MNFHIKVNMDNAEFHEEADDYLYAPEALTRILRRVADRVTTELVYSKGTLDILDTSGNKVGAAWVSSE